MKEMSIVIDKNKLDFGIVGVSYNDSLPADGSRIKVYTNKKGSTEYHYTVWERDTLLYYPLQYGNGEYSIRVFRESKPNTSKYQSIFSQNVQVNTSNALNVFLQSNVNMMWNPDMRCIAFAKELTKGLSVDYDKANTVWKYIVSNFNYDYPLAVKIKENGTKYNYAPNIELTYTVRKDICFGLTSLFNSMLRSVGVYAKMNHGYAKLSSDYHAWSEVYFNNVWNTIDVTFDISQNFRDKIVIREPSDYSVKYFY